ncbi:MAG: amidohydrolase family protein [Deltaproteobacteria bacterium]|nr:amidohydrolase family protein [Deltaproteobacteria bacterium]MBW2340204.1 amidohydrolase family protein [Deltaproteobacteria bacterium]
MSKTLLKNIGTILSGDIANPVLQGDSILVDGASIAGIGKEGDISTGDIEKIIDINGATVAPGLIDSHCHVCVGDYTPRQFATNFIEGELHGGVTTVISAGEVHYPGRPKDASGAKALAILSAKAYANFRPGGVKVIGGGLILEEGLTEKDFEEMAKEGVRVVGEIGLGSVKQPEDAAPLVKLAKKYGMTVMMHTGGTSIPGSATVTAAMVKATDPDIVSHLNGGPTAIPLSEVEPLIKETNYFLEIVQCGNPLVAVDAIKMIKGNKAMSRLIIGNDMPSGTGVISLGILRTLNLISSLGGISGPEAVATATGNTARCHNLNRGLIKDGYEADLIMMDTPMGSVGKDAVGAIEAGDIPGIGLVMVDGVVKAQVSRNTPPPVRKCAISAPEQSIG